MPFTEEEAVTLGREGYTIRSNHSGTPIVAYKENDVIIINIDKWAKKYNVELTVRYGSCFGGNFRSFEDDDGGRDAFDFGKRVETFEEVLPTVEQLKHEIRTAVQLLLWEHINKL